MFLFKSLNDLSIELLYFNNDVHPEANIINWHASRRETTVLLLD